MTALGVGLAAWAWRLGDRPPAWYPRCLFQMTTGLYCPGCGSARTLHAALHGDWPRALASNALIVVAAPLLAAWAAAGWWRAVRHNAPPPDLPAGSARLALVVVLLFAVARNLPWWPFTLLAPH